MEKSEQILIAAVATNVLLNIDAMTWTCGIPDLFSQDALKDLQEE